MTTNDMSIHWLWPYAAVAAVLVAAVLVAVIAIDLPRPQASPAGRHAGIQS